MIIIAIVVGIGVAIETCAVIRAPLGYQDETGFHVGPEANQE